jgi:hypothetical protein
LKKRFNSANNSFGVCGIKPFSVSEASKEGELALCVEAGVALNTLEHPLE